MRHHITIQGPPVFAKPRHLSADKYEYAKRAFDQMMRQGICRPSHSPWASPLVLVPKEDHSWGICGDYRSLNFTTVPDQYPAVPHIHDVNAKLHGRIIFSKIDLVKAYHQIPMDPADIEKTAVITPFGLFEYLVMPFGLRNAGATFQRAIDNILYDLECATPYI